MATVKKSETLFSRSLDSFFSDMAELARFAANFFREGLKPPTNLKR